MMERYKKQLEETVNEAKRLAFECDSWILRKSAPTTEYYSTEVPYSRNPVFKAETLVNVEPKKLLDMVRPVGQYRLQWDPFSDSNYLIETITEEEIIAYQVTKPMLKGLIKTRDTVDVFQTKWTDYGSCIYSSIHYDGSISHQSPHYVRGWNYPCGIFFIPTEMPNKSKVIIVLNVDMRIQFLNMALPIPQYVLENVCVRKMGQYIDALKSTKNIKWQMVT